MSYPPFDDTCLLLNDTTLWFFTSLSKDKKDVSGLVQNWVSDVKSSSSSAQPVSTRSTNSTGSGSKTTLLTLPLSQVKRRPSKLQDELPVGGLDDEVEIIEREAAIHSPKKGKKCLTSSGMVKMEPVDTSTDDLEVVTAGSNQPGRKRKPAGSRYTNADLPGGSEIIFRQVVIPTLYQLVSTIENGWEIPDSTFIRMLQSIWAVAFRNKKDLVNEEIELRGPIFAVAMQRLTEYRSGFASAAIAVIDHFFSTALDPDMQELAFPTTASRAEYASEAIAAPKFDFIWLDSVNAKGLFQAPLLLQTFAHHFSAVKGALPSSSLLQLTDKPRFALAIAAASVERAFQKWIDAEEKDIDVDAKAAEWKGIVPQFNADGYMAKTQLYHESVQNLSAKKWERILEGAEKFVKQGKRGGRSGGGPLGVDMGSEVRDGRALLIEADMDEEAMEEDT